mmetsp:Transcript_97111/g.271139  ORF Transcript_97111/g.271139 Transcript_97111/m.271139 type:complete len:283 (-) Transcript_97111:140-988(-)
MIPTFVVYGPVRKQQQALAAIDQRFYSRPGLGHIWMAITTVRHKSRYAQFLDHVVRGHVLFQDEDDQLTWIIIQELLHNRQRINKLGITKATVAVTEIHRAWSGQVIAACVRGPTIMQIKHESPNASRQRFAPIGQIVGEIPLQFLRRHGIVDRGESRLVDALPAGGLLEVAARRARLQNGGLRHHGRREIATINLVALVARLVRDDDHGDDSGCEQGERTRHDQPMAPSEPQPPRLEVLEVFVTCSFVYFKGAGRRRVLISQRPRYHTLAIGDMRAVHAAK